MRGGISLSALLHLAIMALIYFGLPNLFKQQPIEDQPIAVELVMVAPQTRATRHNETPPVPKAKPEEQVAQAAPEPPKPAPVTPPPPEPPPSPPPPPPPEPKPEPEPPQPQPPKPPPPPPPPPPAPETPKPPEPKPPEPKPEPPKPPEPKPPEPKPEPPKPPEPKPPAPPRPKPEPPRKQDDRSFDALLRNLAQQPAPAHESQTPPRPQQPRMAAAASSQPIAPLGARLTTSELDLVKRQIAQCWNVPAGALNAKNLIVEIEVEANSDATVRSAHIVDSSRMGDPFFRAAAESALRALRNPACVPLKLPLDKYQEWKTFTLTFDPKDVS